MSITLRRSILEGKAWLEKERRTDGTWGPEGPPLVRVTATALASEALGIGSEDITAFISQNLTEGGEMTRTIAWSLASPGALPICANLIQRLLNLEKRATGGWGHASPAFAKSRGRSQLAISSLLPTFLACRSLHRFRERPEVHAAIERAADWIQREVGEFGSFDDTVPTYPICGSAFALSVLRWAQTHRTPERLFTSISNRLRQWALEGDFPEETVPDAGRNLDTPYGLCTTVWAILALLEDGRPESHESIIILARQLLALQRPLGWFARDSRASGSEVYATCQSILALNRLDSYLRSDIARDCAISAGSFKSALNSIEGKQADVCIVCALDIELEAVFRVSKDLGWQRLPVVDTNDFFQARLSTAQGRTLTVIIAKSGRMGMTSSAALTTKLILLFKPRLLCMVGIAAGTRALDRGYGDILLASPAFDYTSGKWKEEGSFFWRQLYLEPDPHPVDIAEVLRNRLNASKTKYVDLIRRAW